MDITLAEFKSNLISSINKIDEVPKELRGEYYINGQKQIVSVKIVLDVLSCAGLSLSDATYVLDRSKEIITNHTKLDQEYIRLSPMEVIVS